MNLRLTSQYCLALPALLALLAAETLADVQQTDMAGARVKFVNYQGPAAMAVNVAANRCLRITVDPRSEKQALTVGVELPNSAQNTWAADVVVVDAKGRPLAVRRSGIEWHKLVFPVPAEPATYEVRVVEPPGARPPAFPESDREATEATTGLKATIPRWHDGRRAALSIRFDDSHPSHLSKAIPILREYGFRGTFMVCPGESARNSRHRSDFEDHRAAWEAVAQRGDQELANHSAHHRGAIGDQDMEREIGEASQAIWKLFPGKSKLLALNLGGGTSWETTRPLRYYLDKYHLFESSGSLGMDDVYRDRPAAFREHLERHLERGLWCRIHFHAIGEKLASSEANFRAALEIAKEHESSLWIAGMADIHKYQTERLAAKLRLAGETADRVRLTLSCFTDPQLYDQPLTIDVAMPAGWSQSRVHVKQTGSREANVSTAAVPTTGTLRFHALPITSTYVIERILP